MLKKSYLSSFIAGLLLSSTVVFSSHADVVAVDASELKMNAELSKDIQQTLLFLQYRHYLPAEIDDEYSSKMLDGYLKLLDPNKIYFTQSDIDVFNKYRYKLDDFLKKRNAQIGFSIFKVYRERMVERTNEIMELIKSDFDFTKNESIDIDRDNFTWAKDKKELTDTLRKRIKNDTLLQLMSDTPITEIRENLSRRYQRQKDTVFQLKADEVFEWFMNAFAQELGPHTQYMSHATTENFNISMSLSLEGIGAALQTDEDYVVINRIIKGGPAEKSGVIKPEDKIVGVAQDGEKMINVIGWRLMDVVQMIRGKKGTKVNLQVIPAGSAPGAAPEIITLTRDVIELEDQAAKMSSVTLPDGDDEKNFSVISIPSFYSNQGRIPKGGKFTATTHDVKKLIEQMKDEGSSDGLIIDLRGNGGGFLNEAVSLTGLFIDKGPVVQVVPSNRKAQVLNDTDSSVAYDGPLLVLIDRFSASASEIFAAAMQDYGRATIIGERSFGKGTVQQVAPLRNRFQKSSDNEHNSQVKFTNAQFFRVSGGSTQHKGVEPDIYLNSGKEDKEFGERAYDNALPWSETDAAKYASKSISKEMVESLTKEHIKRSKESPAFTFLRQNSDRIAKNKDIKSLSLNMKERQTERDRREQQSLAELNAYRATLGLEAVTAETRKDNPLPGDDEHWPKVYQKEAAHVLFDMIKWSDSSLSKVSKK